MATTPLVPVLFLDQLNPSCSPVPGQLLLYARRSNLKLRRDDCTETDLVLDRKLEGFQPLSTYSALTVNDSVLTALMKLDAGVRLGGADGEMPGSSVVALTYEQTLALLATQAVSAATLYCILDFPGQDGLVFVQGLNGTHFTPSGWLVTTQQATLVEVNVPAGTLTPFVVKLPPLRNVDEVPTSKALQVIGANQKRLVETDSSFDGKSILDDRDPNNIILYLCRKSRPQQPLPPGTAPTYVWVRVPCL